MPMKENGNLEISGNFVETDPIPRRRLAPVRVACKYGCISRSKAYNLINRGKIRAYKLDFRTLIDLDSIDELYATLPRVNNGAAIEASRHRKTRKDCRIQIETETYKLQECWYLCW